MDHPFCALRNKQESCICSSVLSSVCFGVCQNSCPGLHPTLYHNLVINLCTLESLICVHDDRPHKAT
jgi:hypothetical protein